MYFWTAPTKLQALKDLASKGLSAKGPASKDSSKKDSDLKRSGVLNFKKSRGKVHTAKGLNLTFSSKLVLKTFLALL
jgi:hypothetical protein